MKNDKTALTAERVQAEYQKGVQYNTGLGLYDDVKQCENFVRASSGGPEKQEPAAYHDECTGSDCTLQGGADRFQ